jgi:cell wall-associated NlpC family hydrolase
MPAANGRCRYCLCAIIGTLALAAAPIANAQLAARHSAASKVAEPPQGRPKAAPAQGEDFGRVLPASNPGAGAQDVAIYALAMIGIDYRFGGSTPESGLDCSGLVQYVFQQVTGVTLPRTAKEMSGLGTKVKMGELMAGDLVFFNTRRFSFSHVGISLGGQRFIHAPSRGGEVEIAVLSESYWHRRFDGARRLVGVPPPSMPRIVPPGFGDSIAVIAPADFASATYAEPPP